MSGVNIFGVPLSPSPRDARFLVNRDDKKRRTRSVRVK